MAVKGFWTTSRVKVWWFTNVTRYDIKGQTQLPKRGPSGKIYNQRRWLLLPHSALMRNGAMKERP